METKTTGTMNEQTANPGNGEATAKTEGTKKQMTKEEYLKYCGASIQFLMRMTGSVKPAPDGSYNYGPCFNFIKTQVARTYDLVFATKLLFVVAGTVHKTTKDKKSEQKAFDQTLIFIDGLMHSMKSGNAALKGQIYNEIIMNLYLPVFAEVSDFRYSVLERLTKNVDLLGTHQYLAKAIEKEMKKSIDSYNIELTDKLEGLLESIKVAS